MGHDPELEYQVIQRAYEISRGFRHAQQKARGEVNYSALSTYSRLSISNNLAIAAMCSGLNYSSSQSKILITDSDRKLATVIAHFIQSIEATEICITNGMYAAAATLIRREMEAVDACRGLLEGTQKEGKTPQIKAMKLFGRAYGDFSGLAHNSGFTLMRHLSGPEVASVDTIENPDFDRAALGIHIYCVLGISDALRFSHDQKHENHWINQKLEFHHRSLEILIEQGILSPTGDS